MSIITESYKSSLLSGLQIFLLLPNPHSRGPNHDFKSWVWHCQTSHFYDAIDSDFSVYLNSVSKLTKKSHFAWILFEKSRFLRKRHLAKKEVFQETFIETTIENRFSERITRPWNSSRWHVIRFCRDLSHCLCLLMLNECPRQDVSI